MEQTVISAGFTEIQNNEQNAKQIEQKVEHNGWKDKEDEREKLVAEHKQKIAALNAENKAKLATVDNEIKDLKLKYYEQKVRELEEELAQKKN